MAWEAIKTTERRYIPAWLGHGEGRADPAGPLQIAMWQFVGILLRALLANATSARRAHKKCPLRAGLPRSPSLWTTLSGFESLPPSQLRSHPLARCLVGTDSCADRLAFRSPVLGAESLPPSHFADSRHWPHRLATVCGFLRLVTTDWAENTDFAVGSANERRRCGRVAQRQRRINSICPRRPLTVLCVRVCP